MARTKFGKTNFREIQLRARAVALKDAGKTYAVIAKDLGRSMRWVKKWVQRFRECGDLEDKPRAGRPSVLTNRIKDVIRETRGKRGKSCRKISRRLHNLGEQVSKDTVHRYLTKGLGCKPSRRGKRPCLTALQKRKRLAFASKFSKLSKNDWENLIFF